MPCREVWQKRKAEARPMFWHAGRIMSRIWPIFHALSAGNNAPVSQIGQVFFLALHHACSARKRAMTSLKAAGLVTEKPWPPSGVRERREPGMARASASEL